MSVIKTASKRTRSSARTEREPTPYDNLWLNIGIRTPAPTAEDAEATKFLRLPRGVAVADLDTKKVYANMNDDFAGEVTLMNQVIEQIRAKGLTLEAGESIEIGLEVQLYTAQEDVVVKPVVADKTIAAQLFEDL